MKIALTLPGKVDVGRYGCLNDGMLTIDRRFIEYCGGKELSK